MSSRIRIVGTSGSGKTHLGQVAAQALGVAHLELDAVFWDRDWTMRDPDEARALVRAFVTAHPEGWVADGNWAGHLDGLLDPGTPGGADLFVWLDHSRATVMRRVIWRTVRRAILREELWHGNRERPRTWLTWNPEDNIICWAWTSYPHTKARMQEQIEQGMPVLRLRGQRAVDAWVASLGADAGGVARPDPRTRA